MATNFGLTTSSTAAQIIQSLNYALANMNTGSSVVNYNGNVLIANTTTGAISTLTGTAVPLSYLYGYVDVMYANNATGGSGFNSNSTMANYYGIRNTNSPVQDTNPVDYTWTQVSGGFGSTNSLWYMTIGGGQINFSIANVAPTIHYSSVTDSTPILLASLANSIVTASSIQPHVITGNLIAAATLTGTNLVPNTVTGNLIAQNTLTGNLIVPGTITGNLITANTINATSIVAGSITATQLEANLLVVGNIVSFGSNIEINSGTGYWMDFTTGNAYLGGNTTIGNKLKVGTNATIGDNLTVGNNLNVGNNLTVGGLISAGTLVSNSVITSTIVPNSISLTTATATPTTQTYTSMSGVCYYTHANTTMTTANTGAIVSVWGQYVCDFDTAPSGGTGQLSILSSLYRYGYDGFSGNTNVLLMSQVTILPVGSYPVYLAPTFIINDYPPSTGSYMYSMGAQLYTGSVNISSAVILDYISGSMILQVLKR